jgi:biopolymer transport protein ExbD
MKFYGPFENDDEVSMNMTPMIDVVFLMTIFFLASAALSIGGQDTIELPTASEAQLARRLNPESITINVEAVPGGAAFAVSQKGYSYGELLKKLRTMAESAELLKKPAPPIILRADFRVPYKHVQELMFDCAAMGIQVFDFQAVGGEEIPR